MTTQHHPGKSQLIDFLSGRLDDDSVEKVTSHLEACHLCQDTLAELEDHADTLIGTLRGGQENEPFCDEAEFANAVAAVQNPRWDQITEPTSGLDDFEMDSDPDPVPATLRDYEVLGRLGRGGMGLVYKARHTKLDRLVALKVLSTDRLKDEQAVARFAREIRAVGNLDHPNIVRAYDAGEVDGKHFLVMEYVDGLDLAALVRQCGPLPIANACELVRQAAIGLQHAYEHGRVHRDIKPSNLMVSRSGVVKILDLGLARLHTKAYPQDHPGLTQSDQIMGTPDYMAPEQCGGSRNVDIRCDVYGLGATLYFLLTGQPPYSGERYDTLPKKIAGLARDPVPPVTELRSDLPTQLVAVLDRMLAKDPEQRFATPEEVAEALSPFAAGHNVERSLDGSAVATSAQPASEVVSHADVSPSVRTAAMEGARVRKIGSYAFAIAAPLAILLVAATLLLTLRTSQGTLVVEVPEEQRENIEVELRQDTQVHIANEKEGWTIKLNEGKWDVTVKDPDRFVLDQHTVTIHRGEQQRVRVTWRKAPGNGRATVAAASAAAAASVSNSRVAATPSPSTAADASREPFAASTPPNSARTQPATSGSATFPAATGTVDPVFAVVRLPDLKLTEGELPVAAPGRVPPRRGWETPAAMQGYAVVDGPGEAYVTTSAPEPRAGRVPDVSDLMLAISVPAARSVSGYLYVPHDFGSDEGPHAVRLAFAIDAKDLQHDDRGRFYRAKAQYYQDLLDREIPGGAWFRYQRDQARSQLEPHDRTTRDTRPQRRQTVGETQLARTYNLVSGGLAISENLQLDRALPEPRDGEGLQDVDAIPGITTRAFDWTPLVQGIDPQLDPQAQIIPDDQYALFFPSFQALLDVMDRADLFGTSVLRQVEPRGEDARTRERYERQLGLPLDVLARKLGPQLVASVAVTGSDPYLRTGSDVAILFEPKDRLALQTLLAAQCALSASREANAKKVDGEIAGIAYSGFVSPDRTISSYRATLGDTIVVTNSPAQLDRLVAAFQNKLPALASLPEYKYFRHRYPRGDEHESALLVISDSAIRRWCSARWRIGASRRLRAAAALADLEARRLDHKQSNLPPTSHVQEPKQYQPLLGTVTWRGDTAVSPIYGSLAFLTPIVELDLDKVTQSEANMYRQWRDGYQQNWRRFFDPIAIQLTVRDDQLNADVTVMPLIAGSQYRQLMAVALGAQIDPQEMDRHRESILHAAWAVNRESEPVRNFLGFTTQLAPQVTVSPVDWIGETVSVYLDDDPLWDEIAQSDRPTPRDLVKHLHRLPIALVVDVRDGLKLTAFLAGVRGFIEQTAPGMTVWETREHGQVPYVRIGLSERGRSQVAQLEEQLQQTAIYYAASGDALIVALREDVLHRALDRQAKRSGSSDTPPQPVTDGSAETPAAELADQPVQKVDSAKIPGIHLVVEARQRVIKALEALYAESYRQHMREIAWANLPILNEWKRRFPDEDPVQLHARYFHRQLTCPAGGQYRWHPQWQTMESTVFGHPGDWKGGPSIPPALAQILSGQFGLTFENDGLRSRVSLVTTANQSEVTRESPSEVTRANQSEVTRESPSEVTRENQSEVTRESPSEVTRENQSD